MADTKDEVVFLQDSYYGPSIPPAQPIVTSSTGGDDGRSTYALICTLFRALTTALIAVGITILVLWLIYMPRSLSVYVESATLTRFDLSPTNRTLYYNFTLDISVRNPNRRVGVDYERLDTTVSYDGSRFYFQSYPPFYQRRKNTTTLIPSFAGQAVLPGDSVAETYEREKGEGWFYVGVKVQTKVRLKIVVVHSVRYTPDVDCFIRLPVPSNATSVAAGFTRTECDVDSFA